MSASVSLIRLENVKMTCFGLSLKQPQYTVSLHYLDSCKIWMSPRERNSPQTVATSIVHGFYAILVSPQVTGNPIQQMREIRYKILRKSKINDATF